MTMKKTSCILILGLLLIFVPLTSTVFNVENRTAEVDTPFVSAPPVITDMGGGIHTTVPFDYWENFTGNGPYDFGSYESWTLFWYVNFTSDAPIETFHYNTTYGSLDSYNGSFTPLDPTLGPGSSSENKMTCFVAPNSDELADFGWEVKVWIEDSDGLISSPFTKLFKYNNGTIEDPEEELTFTATAESTIVDPSDEIVVNFNVSGTLSVYQFYWINYTVNSSGVEELNGEGYPIFLGPTQFRFQHETLIWENQTWYTFEFCLYEFESGDYWNTGLTDTVSVYVDGSGELIINANLHESIADGIIHPFETVYAYVSYHDPIGGRQFTYHTVCNYPYFTQRIEYPGIIFDPVPHSAPAQWSSGHNVTFTIYLFRVDEGEEYNTTLFDTLSVYVTSPPENGTLTATFDRRDDDGYPVYTIYYYGWEDELDGDGPFYSRSFCYNEIYEPEYPGALMIDYTYDNPYEITIKPEYAGYIYARIYDSHGAYVEINLGDLGERPDQVPGYSVYIIVTSILATIGILIWKFKRKPALV